MCTQFSRPMSTKIRHLKRKALGIEQTAHISSLAMTPQAARLFYCQVPTTGCAKARRVRVSLSLSVSHIAACSDDRVAPIEVAVTMALRRAERTSRADFSRVPICYPAGGSGSLVFFNREINLIGHPIRTRSICNTNQIRKVLRRNLPPSCQWAGYLIRSKRLKCLVLAQSSRLSVDRLATDKPE